MEEARVKWTIPPGVAYNRVETGANSWNFPLEIAAEWGREHQATRVKFITDGYARSTNGGDPAGWNDFKIIVEREMNAIIALFGGVAIPAHGEVGG